MAFRTYSNGEVLTATHLNDYLQKQAVIVCTSGTRPTGVEGMLIYETDNKNYMMYNGSSWQRTGAMDQNAYGAQQQTEATSHTSITSTSYASGSPNCSIVFTAPPSGTIIVSVSGYLIQSNNGNETRLGWSIRTGGTVGSGTEIWAPTFTRGLNTSRAVNASGAAVINATHRYMAGSLTPLATYNIRTMHVVTGGSGQIDFRHLMIEPVL